MRLLAYIESVFSDTVAHGTGVQGLWHTWSPYFQKEAHGTGVSETSDIPVPVFSVTGQNLVSAISVSVL